MRILDSAAKMAKERRKKKDAELKRRKKKEFQEFERSLGSKIVKSFDVKSVERGERDGEKHVSGSLILTRLGMIFLVPPQLRLNECKYEDIERVDVSSKGGIINTRLAVTYSSGRGKVTNEYVMTKWTARDVRSSFDRELRLAYRPELLKKRILQIVKPKGRMHISEIEKNERITTTMSRIRAYHTHALPDSETHDVIRDTIGLLISEGELDGIITQEDEYVSDSMLTRKTIHYEVTIDFNSVLKQLQNRGIILQTIDCPSCGGKIDYPETGSTIECKFCGSNITALDIFERFKSLLS